MSQGLLLLTKIFNQKMKCSWLNKENNQECILFFNGWGMDANSVSHMQTGSYDILMLNDYNPVSPITEDLGSYNSVYVVAWSLGVWAVSMIEPTLPNLTKAIAINGTQNPVDETEGIDPLVFHNTLRYLTKQSYSGFCIRMFGGVKKYNENLNRISKTDFDKQHEELISISRQLSVDETCEFKFDTALIGSDDYIFTRKNQYNYWRNRTRIVNRAISHYPFRIFNNWEEIINL